MKNFLKLTLIFSFSLMLVACGGGGAEDEILNTNTNSDNGNNGGGDSTPTLSTISVTPNGSSIISGANLQMSANGTFSDGANQSVTNSVSWSVDDNNVASISSSGMLSGLNAGSVVVTASEAGVSGTATVMIAGISSVSVTPLNPSILVGNTVQMTASANYSNGTVTNVTSTAIWSSSDSSVATVTPTGEITAVGPGMATIMVTVDGVTATFIVNSTAPVAGALQFSEIGSGSSNNGFWFEVYNPAANPVDLAQYTLQSQNTDTLGTVTDVSFTLPAKTIPAGGFLVIMTRDIFSFFNNPSFSSNPNVVILSDADYTWGSGGYLELLDAGVTADFVRFGGNTKTPTTAGEWGAGAAPALTTNGYGESISRDATNLDTNAASDWSYNSLASMGGPNDITCATDADSDGIPDCTETAGATYAGMDIYAMGARTGQKDLFIEIDYMDPAGRPGEDVQGMVPQREALEKVRDAFLAQGIHVHFDAGDIIDQSPGIDPADFDLGGGEVVPFAEEVDFFDNDVASILDYKAQYLGIERRSLFYYMLLAYSRSGYVAGSFGSSGASEVLGNDILVSIGHWGHSRVDTLETNKVINNQAGTIMHEFGHSLGLNHGGDDDVNDKPNYISVMNYLYQIAGLPDIGNDEGDRQYADKFTGNSNCDIGLTNSPFGSYLNFRIDYSQGGSIDLDENVGITESAGFGRPGSVGVDFNCDGDTNDVLTSFEVNGDTSLEVLSDHDDWSNIQFFFTNASNRIANGQVLNDDNSEVTINLFTGNDWREPKEIISESDLSGFLANAFMGVQRQIIEAQAEYEGPN